MTNISDLNDDLSDLLGQPAQAPRPAPVDADLTRIRETVPEFVESCPKCHGTGMFKGYSGRVIGKCFACKGQGKHSFKTAPEVRAQAKSYRAALPGKRWDVFSAKYPAAAAWMTAKASSFEFAKSMIDAVDKYGDLTSNQMTAVDRCVQRDVERDQQRAQAAEQRSAAAPSVEQRSAAAPSVDASKIVEAIQAGKQSGLKWVCLRFSGLTIYEAKKHPGTLYVKQGRGEEGIYVGKITDGRFLASRDCTAELQAKVILIASDPANAAKVYGKETGECCCCGRELTDPVSIAAGIGPICGDRFGFSQSVAIGLGSRMIVHILYPERRSVPAATISSWYHDAVANGQVSDDYLDVPDSDPRRQASALDDTGLITIQRIED